MPSPTYLMALDCGSGGLKCFLVDAVGMINSQVEVEWDRDAWSTEIGWRAIKKGVRKTLASGVDPAQIAGVSTTSMREEFVLLDRHGREITYKITPDIYPHGDALNKSLGERMYRRSGHWPVPGWIAAAKLAWLRDRHLDVIERARLFLMISDWAGYAFGGVPYTDASSACETSLFDVAKGSWSWELINELGLPREMFPEVKESGSIVSKVTSTAAKETTLKEGTPVIVGGADTQCGLIGCGAVEEGEIVAVGGTTTPIQMVTRRPIFDPKGRTWTNAHVASGRWIIESNAGRTGWVYRWFRDSILGAKPSPRVYETINSLAASSPPGSASVRVFLGPHIFSCGPPYWEGDNLSDAPVPPTITGSSRFTRGDLARAIIEANCYAVRANLEQLVEITGIKVDRLGFCGGNSKSDLWNQIQAAVINRPLIVPKERDATAVGAAILAAVGAGIYSDIHQAIENMVRHEEPLIPNIQLAETYDSLYHSWVETRRRLSGSL